MTSTIYLDTSALTKLAVLEDESPAMGRFLADHPRCASSALTQVELTRVLLRHPRHAAAAADLAAAVLARLFLQVLDASILARAATLPPPLLRSLDALHLASALSLPDCAGLVTYDRRLLEAAAYHGLQTWSPGA